MINPATDVATLFKKMNPTRTAWLKELAHWSKTCEEGEGQRQPEVVFSNKNFTADPAPGWFTASGQQPAGRPTAPYIGGHFIGVSDRLPDQNARGPAIRKVLRPDRNRYTITLRAPG
jgi:hypothetical protein